MYKVDAGIALDIPGAISKLGIGLLARLVGKVDRSHNSMSFTH